MDNEPSRFFCTRCGKEGLPILRKPSAYREPGHLKKLYCLNCQMETNHAEVRPNSTKYTVEDFQEEFQLGRFVDGNKRPIAELISCSKVKCEYNKCGKCWNDNNSAQCKYKKGLIRDER